MACELFTGAWSLYIILYYASTSTMSPVSVVDYLLRAGAALLIGSAVWKRRAWAPVGVVLFAAYIGIPTLIRLSKTVIMWKMGVPSSDLWFDVGGLAVNIAQLLALAGGLHELGLGRSAA